jgi:hypothetical protein
LSLSGVIATPALVRSAQFCLALGFQRFHTGLVVRGVAVPLTLCLLEVLVVGHYLLRVCTVVLCRAAPAAARTATGRVVTGAAEVAQYQCAVNVVQRGPFKMLLAVMLLLCVRAILRGCLPRVLPQVRTRVLLNRE